MRPASADDVRSRRWLRLLAGSTGLITAAVVVLMAASFLLQRHVARSSFERLEAQQVAQDAQRVRTGLDSWVSLLRNYGATNSIWDSAYDDVASGDQKSFLADFPPADVHDLYGLSGVVAVGPDGAVRAGGLVADDGYTSLPARLADPARLAALYEPDAEAGDSRCGVVRAEVDAFVYCGFAVRRSDGSGADVGGLVFLQALSGAGLAALGEQVSMPLSLLPGEPGGSGQASQIDSGSIGALKVDTLVRDENRIDLVVGVPVEGGGTVWLAAGRDRPIHQESGTVLNRLMAITGVLGLLVLVIARWMSHREVQRQAKPLRRTTEAVVLGGDRGARVPAGGSGALAELGQDINRMLDAMAVQDAEIAAAGAQREELARESHHQQRDSALILRERAQSAVDDTLSAVMQELDEVAGHAGAVQDIVTQIDRSAAATADVTRAARQVAVTGQRSAEEATSNLREVGGVIEAIATLAAQTRLLALNATIEAARAGEAGRGFAVVAGEVKQLADDTATSTSRITQTLTGLQTNVTGLTAVIDELSGAVGGVQQQTHELGEISSTQRRTMDGLDERLRQAVDRIHDLSGVGDSIERRAHERVRVDRPVRMTLAQGQVADGAGGPALPGRLRDVSRTGARIAAAAAAPLGSSVRLSTGDGGANGGPGGSADVEATVVRVTRGPGGPQLGVRYTDSDEATIDRFLQKLDVDLPEE